MSTLDFSLCWIRFKYSPREWAPATVLVYDGRMILDEVFIAGVSTLVSVAGGFIFYCIRLLTEDLQPPDNHHETVWSVIIAAFFFGFGFWLVSSLIDAREIANWPTTEGVITEHAISDRRYPPYKIAYRYAVDGVEYQSSGVARNPDERRTKKLVHKLSRDERVKVHFDPTQPSRAYLDVKIDSDEYAGSLAPFVGGSALSALVIRNMLLAWYFRSRKRKEAHLKEWGATP